MTCAHDAPRRLVEGRSAPESMEQWCGPNGYALLSWEVDFRAGGAARLCVRSPEGHDQWVEGADLVIVEPERVVFSGKFGLGDERLTETAGTVTFRRTERSE